MIRSFRVKNFRSCRDVSVEGMGRILALAGRNGAGKTNILEAIDGLAKTATAYPWQFGVGLSAQEKIGGEITFDAGGRAYRYQAESLMTRSAPPNRPAIHLEEHLYVGSRESRQLLARSGEIVRFADHPEFKIGELALAMPALLSFLPADAAHRDELESALKFLSAIRYYPLDEPSHPNASAPIHRDEYANWLAQYKSNLAESDSVLMRLLHLHQTSKESFNELKEIIGDNGLSLISDIEVMPFTLSGTRYQAVENIAREDEVEYFYLRFVPSQCRASVDYGGLSLGTRRVLRIITSVVLDQSAVMLMEQPEDAIHSGLMKKVIGFLRQNSTTTQIILASHSVSVFNRMRPEEVRLVALKNGETTVRALNDNELSAAQTFLQEDGPLSDFLMLVGDE